MEILKILILEDDNNDVELMKEELIASLNYELRFAIVKNKKTFIQKLGSFKPDIILSDYKIPAFSGYDALEIAIKTAYDTPFIIVTGTLTEEVAADSILKGAWDYVVKERLHRLPSSINNALKLKDEKLKSKKTSEELKLLKDKSGIQLKLLWDALQKAPGSVFITDKQGNIQYVNSKFEEVTGYKAQEVIGKTPSILRSGFHDEAFYKNLWDTILEGKEWRGEITNKNKGGDTIWEDISISPIMDKNGQIQHFVAIKQDITERKKTEKELRAAKEHAEESDRLKSAFLANMSHEIRTPMNGILGFIELLEGQDISEEDHIMYTSIIKRNGERLLNTINDLIEVSQIESDQVPLNFSEFDVHELLKYLLHHFAPEASERNLSLSIKSKFSADPFLIQSDKNKIESILSNLIKNALKFTNQGTIEFGYHIENGFLKFFVEDTGMGIPVQRQEAIFDRFVQADLSITKPYEGSGLGLSIAKAYAEILGGHIWVESDVGQGARFYFTIPFNVQPFEPNKKEKISKEFTNNQDKLKNLHVLIVEDDESSDHFLTLVLQGISKKIDHTKTGTEAVAFCKQNKDIDLILMDIKMPHLDGLKATQAIRKFNPDVLIIAQTAYALEGDKEKALKAGCNDYIAKPIKRTELLNIIAKHL